MMGNYKTKERKKYLNNPALKETNLSEIEFLIEIVKTIDYINNKEIRNFIE